MEYSADSTRAALLLTNRLVPLAATPMTAREFWALVERLDPADLLPLDPGSIAEQLGTDADEAVRLRTLLDASMALSFEQERLHDGGVSLVSALDAVFPSILRERLGAACPPFLLVAGRSDVLGQPALAVVGPRDASDAALDVAARAAELAVGHGWAVVTGLAQGVAQAAMGGAADAGGVVIGVPAEGITRASRSAEVRRRVHAGQLCIASPYAPDAPSRAAAALGRNKIVHALSQAVFVAAVDNGTAGSRTAGSRTAGTWAGAKETLERRDVPVGVWAGDGATDANQTLARLGATPITELSNLFDLQPPGPSPSQDPLF